MTISEFQEEYRFLSNFWYAPNKITLDGIMEYKDNLWYPTVEHAYQAAKSTEKDVFLNRVSRIAKNLNHILT